MEHIRPVLDAVENLRRLNISNKRIQLPTIVIVGDQSSGKSSILESLTGISLHRGQGICTRVATDESHVSDAIRVATDELAGDGKGISNTPLTIVVKKNGVPDLTVVDLSGITRVSIQGQPKDIFYLSATKPKDIYDQIEDIVMEYIRHEESIIVNVLSATVDLYACESIRMSQGVDKTGERTLAVVIKADMAP
ncbi:putative dynamin-related protein 4A [Glycine max]|nr:putative dynamin-related protein 4A [Glycine max]